MRLKLWVLGVILALSAPSLGRAQPTGATGAPTASAGPGVEAAKEEAQDAFLKGREASKAGDNRSALAFFQKSYSLYPRPGTLFNVAICEQDLGMLASALKHFKELLPQLQGGDDRIPDATNRIAELEPRAPRLWLRLASGAPAKTVVYLDGVVLTASSFEVDLPMDPGDHEIVMAVPGRPSQSYKVKLAEGMRIEKLVEPTPEKVNVINQPPSPTTGMADNSETQQKGAARTAGFVVGGVGLVGLGVGAVTGILAITKKNQVDEICPAAACTREGVDIENSGKALASASTAAFLVGVAGIGVGTFLVLWNGGEPGKGTAVIAPSAMPGGMGVTALGSF